MLAVAAEPMLRRQGAYPYRVRGSSIFWPTRCVSAAAAHDCTSRRRLQADAMRASFPVRMQHLDNGFAIAGRDEKQDQFEVGWLDVTQQGLSPCKKRQASPGALTSEFSWYDIYNASAPLVRRLTPELSRRAQRVQLA
jgi:hypothetical protein